MQAKAHFAQFLIQQAWQQTLIDQKPHKPWSWADTYPVAKLTLLADGGEGKYRKSEPLYVLSGASGRNLAFGPATLDGAGLDAFEGSRVIAGHNDTHFSILNGIKPGQKINIQSADEHEQLFRVTSTQIVHESDVYQLEPIHSQQLTLITCYPFNRLESNGALRLLVKAVPV